MKTIPLPGRSKVRPTLWQTVRAARRLWWGFGLTTLLAGLLASRVAPDKVSLQAGDVAPKDIVARRSIAYPSSIATESARETAALRIPRQYDNDPRAASEAGRILTTIFGVLQSEKDSPRHDDLPTRIKDAQQALPANVRISPAAIQTALTASDATLKDLKGRAEQVVAQVMDTDIRSENESVDVARHDAGRLAAGLHLPADATALVADTAQSAIRPNRIFNQQATDAARDEARRAVAVIEKSIAKDELIVAKGEAVTPQDVEQFHALRLQQPGLDFPRIIGLWLFLGSVVLSASYFLRYYERRVYNDLRMIRLISLLTVIGALGLKVGYSYLGVPLSPSQLGYLATLWVAVPAMLAAVLINVDTALLISSLLAVTAGVAWEVDARYLAMALVCALVGIYGVSRIRDRGDLVRVAGMVALANASLVWILGLFNGDAQSEMLMGTAWALGTGVGCALFFWIFAAILERPFGLVTHVGLLELSDMNRELLRRLQWEAPGTYHHSLGVATLAEAAAEAIGADALLARVAAYYHDIGKMRRPQYFVENQQDANVHDRLAPSLSSIAITAHVKEGMDLAKQYHLPPVIRDAIVQHHGTSLVSFFYHQATGGEENDDDLEQQFRYEGPKPQSKEMAILMLADAVEAVARTLEKPTPARIEQAVLGIINAKLGDGQFDECDLTFRDIGGIKGAFVRTLASMLHSRIEYPNAPVPEGPPKNGKEIGANGQKDAGGPSAPTTTDAPGRSAAAH
ncbi:MAG TPA: HDIG domain-containing protein [Armatimonadota bacterium]|jgi:hypothetical protein